MNNEIKLCRDCQFFRHGHPMTPRKNACKHPSALDTKDYVHDYDKYHSAEYMRANQCGPEARVFLAEAQSVTFLQRAFGRTK